MAVCMRGPPASRSARTGATALITMEETIFQKIIRGEIPAAKVYETDTVLAFLDIRPVHGGHTLVIPKNPVRDIYELPESDAADLMRAIVRIAGAVKRATGAGGVNIISNNGTAADQVVPHLHFHVIPRFAAGELGVLPHNAYGTDAERDACADGIARELEKDGA